MKTDFWSAIELLGSAQKVTADVADSCHNNTVIDTRRSAS